MDYNDLTINSGFQKNMQDTNWLKLFPKWWSANDPLMNIIGQEITYLKAQAIFELLNTTIKPPVLLWQESIEHKNYTESFAINKKKIIPTIDTETNDEGTLCKILLPIDYDGKILVNDQNITIDIDNIDDNNIQYSFFIYDESDISIKLYDASSYFDCYLGSLAKQFESYCFELVKLPAPQYKTYGTINITNNTIDDVSNFKVALNDVDYIVILDTITQEDKIVVNVGSQKVYINNEEANIIKNGDGLSYFKTGINNEIYDTSTPLHNEAINLTFSCEDVDEINIDVDVIFDRVVFVNEQNIEVHGLELIPLEKIEMYALYDFPYNLESNGWRKVYEKEYDVNTDVIYDMITTHLYTKQFYVEVYFKGLDYPYKVGFPATKNAKSDSIYHINEHIDQWGEYLGLQRRDYKTDIPDEDYPFTYPPYYPYDIEQDYWYYQRLINEYAWNDLAINDVDLLDTEGNPIVRLHSIDPFVQDFVIYANSRYPKERENIDYTIFKPNYVDQSIVEAAYKRVPYSEIQNLLRYDNNKAYITLANKVGTNISAQKYLSKPLIVNFDLTDLPNDIDIDDISVLVEAEATDNNIDKYSNSETGIIIHGISNDLVFPMTQSENYGLQEKTIEYNLSDTIDKIKKSIHNFDTNVLQKIGIKPFKGTPNTYLQIYFTLKENDEIVTDITDVYVTYDNIKTYKGTYVLEDNKQYINVWLPKSDEYTTMRIAFKTNQHNSFSIGNIELAINEYIKTDEDDNETVVTEVYGPIIEDSNKTLYATDEWHTANLRNILQKDSISFVNVFENDSESNTPSIYLKNIQLKINHSNKKPQFKLETQMNYLNLELPSIAQLLVTVTNTGTTQLMTNVDIVNANNIKLSNNYIPVNLNIGESTTETINIYPEYPILDGQYDILTVCEDKTCHNTITLSASGLIQTGIQLEQTYGVYGQQVNFKASVISGNRVINEGKIAIYVDNFKIDDFVVIDNKMEGVAYSPKIFTPGIHTLEARYSGTEKYASSRLTSSLIITKNKTDVELIAEPIIVYNKQYDINTTITSNGFAINEGLVVFYLNDYRLGSKEVVNGQASFTISNFDYPPREYLLKAVYEGTNSFAKKEASQLITIIGGETETTVTEIKAKPDDTVLLKARVTNIYNIPISAGKIQFSIIDDNNVTTNIGDSIDVVKGVAEIPYHISNTILTGLDPNTIKQFTIQANYIDEQDNYQSSFGTNTLTIQRGEVLISCNNVFFGSQYEPLGFFVEIKDAETHKPINDGAVSISIPNLDIECPPVTLNQNGYAIILYNPLKFTADEFKQLLHFYFRQGKLLPCKDANNNNIQLFVNENTQLNNFANDNLYRIYDGELSDLNIMDFDIVESNGERHLVYTIKNKDGTVADMEQIFISDNGHLYARSTFDARDIRQYQEGVFPVSVNYTSESKYKNKNRYNSIEMVKSIVDIDIHSHKVKYNDINKSIICYVTEYNLGTDPTTKIVNDGQVVFFIDNIQVKTSEVVNGMALLSSDDLYDIKYGSHLLTAEYMATNKPHTYTYTDIYVEPITSIIEYDFNKQFKGEKSKLTISIGIGSQYQLPITGDVNIYLDDKLLTSQYLYGIEDMEGNISSDQYDATHIAKTYLEFVIDMPEDIDITKHTLTIEYSGDRHILPSKEIITLEETKLPIQVETTDIHVAQGNMCEVTYDIRSQDDGFINDGEISISSGVTNRIVKAKGYIKNNQVTLKWLVDDDPGEYLYTVELKDSLHYQLTPFIQKIIVDSPYDDVYISHNANDDYTPKFTTLQEALQCVSDTGKIHIIDYANVDTNIVIDKDIEIIGYNNSEIRKDIDDLLINNGIKKYGFSDFDETIHEIVGLTKQHLNTTDFHIIETDVFFVDDNNLVPIFLLNDGKFYSYKQLSLSTILHNCSLTLNGQVKINNIHMLSKDSNNVNDLIVKIENNVQMKKMIIDKTVTINNQKTLTINESAIYGNIVGSKQYNLDNNWWGSNHKPQYKINNQIILKIWTPQDPPVIGENVQIYAGLVGENTITYDLPNLQYHFEAETGDFSNVDGFLVENTARTTYYDGATKCKIYCTVDNETVDLDIYDYDQKTEVILDATKVIPLGYQVPICAKVQSLADTYYLFDENLNVVDNQTSIEGYVNFYLDDKQIGHVRLVDGLAELPLFTSTNKYDDSTEYELKAIYIPSDNHFESSSSKNITFTTEDNICYVSPNGTDDGDGTFGNPYNSIQQAILSNKTTIYLQDGVYVDNNIQVSSTKNIKAYNDNCVFANNTELIFRHTNGVLSLYGLTFDNNNNYIVASTATLNIDKCIVTNHKSNYIIDNGTNTTIINSAIIINNKTTKILQTPSKTYSFSKCWFGTNDPNGTENIENKLNDNITFDNYVVMDFTSSKEKIYLGVVAYLTATIKHYKHGTYTLLSENELPLRVAQFYTTHGTLMPVRDYTYHNQAITFLNTNTDNNADKILIKADTNANYTNRPIVLKCNVRDVQGNTINSGKVRFKFTYNNQDIILYGDINNGVATVTHSTPLVVGKYILECTYEQYKNISTFTVSDPQILVSSFNIIDTDHLYDLTFNLSVADSFGNTNINQTVNIYIDDTFISQAEIIQGQLTKNISYNFLTLDTHELLITTKNVNSNYDLFTVSKTFNVTKKDTYIDFPYVGASLGEEIDITVQIYDNNKRPVQDGYIDIMYDNQIIHMNQKMQYDLNGKINTIPVRNGVATLYKFNTQEQGQHSLVIHYYGTNTAYNDCIHTNNIFNVGLDEVVLESEELTKQLVANIGKEFSLNFPVKDIYGNYVKRGRINLFLDNVILLNNEPINVMNGYAEFIGTLPNDIKVMTHDLSIVYTDPSNKYLQTTYQTKLKVQPIETQIIANTIYATPNSPTVVDYSIESTYGTVRSGRLEAYYGSELIGWSDVSDAITTITINVPMLSAENTYEITLKFIAQDNYANNSITVPMIITKPNVIITPLQEQYYPQTNFNYVVKVTDKNNNNVNFGEVTLYIDNVKTDTRTVQLGKAIIPLSLDTVKDYNFTIIYHSNDYYEETSEEFIFTVDDIKINNITLNNLSSTPNTTLDTTLIFDTLSGFDVKDGYVDIRIDNVKLGTFAIVEDEKYVSIDMPNLDAGTHTLTIDYYDSAIFKDDSFTQNFEITKQHIHLTTPQSISATLNDKISFTTEITEKIDGTLEYALITHENDTTQERFIGIDQINKRNEITFNYQLPNLTQTENTTYEIEVHFVGNTQYYEETKTFPLNISKGDITTLNISLNNVEYQSMLRILIDTEIYNATPVYVYLDDQQIGYKQTDNTNDDDKIEFRYQLDNTYLPNTEHTITAKINESTTFNSKTTTKTFTIDQGTPIIPGNEIEVYVGEKVILPTYVTDQKGFDIESGTLTYTIDEILIGECSPNEDLEYQLDNTYVETKEITVTYEAEEGSYYKDITETITLLLQKNRVNISIDNYGPVTRGTTIEENITLSSPTTTQTQNIPYKVLLEGEDVTESLPNLDIPLTLSDSDKYILNVKFDGNDMFLPFDYKFELINQNASVINLSDVDDLETAISLIGERGVINIDKDIKDVIIANNKHITINGNDHTLTNCQINNTGYLIIKDTIFKESEDSAIKNSGALYVQNCTFNNNEAQYGAAIYIDNRNINTEIDKCTFNGNVASLYGGAIFSNQGNDVTIKESVFTNNKCENYYGSSIASYGHIYISQDMFYENIGQCDVFIASGTCDAENNYFDGSICSIKNQGTTNCELNYWGWNSASNIETNNPTITFDSWLLSRYEIDYKEPTLGNIHQIITAKIDQYKNRLENETSLYKQVIGNIPITVNDETKYLNEEMDFANQNIILKIGQETFNIGA